MTAKIIDFASKRREREQEKKAEEILSYDITSLNEEELKLYIVRLAEFARELDNVEMSIHFPEDDQT